jgi:hypothetical protein
MALLSVAPGSDAARLRRSAAPAPTDAAVRPASPARAQTLFGFTPFPYDATMEAVANTRRTIVPHSTLYALHFDDGIPWKEAVADAPFPARIQREWDEAARAIPASHVVYLALAPLDTDRKSLAPATGEQKRVPMPTKSHRAR